MPAPTPSTEQPSVALSLTQPYASLVVCGAKCIETRSWRTTYRGLLGIHAAKGFPRWARECCAEGHFRVALADVGIQSFTELPLGALLGTVELLDCVPTASIDLRGIGDPECAFGDYGPKRWAWLLAEPRAFSQAIPMKGALSVWRVPSLVAR